MANRVGVLAASRYAVLLLLGMSFIASFAQERAIYLVLMEGEAVAFHGDNLPGQHGRRFDPKSEAAKFHARKLVDSHDQVLQSSLDNGSYNKLYSFKHIVNGFAVHTSPSQAEKLKHAPGIKLVERDRRTKLMTTYSPEFIGLPEGVWTQEGGDRNAGEGVVIGVVDTGINPSHPSFAYDLANPFKSNVSDHFSGACETGPQFPPYSCNGKIVSARFFIAGAQAAASLNATVDIPSPYDAVGHGSHVASTAAGNAGVPVVVNGFYYGRGSGMAPGASIAVYKAVCPTMGTLADVVAAIDQAVADGVDILVLSIGPDEPPEDTVTFLSMFDIAMLFARKAGVFVVQAAGNQGPGPSTVVSYSPWTVGAASSRTDRRYTGSVLLGNGQTVSGVGLSAPTFGNGSFYKLVLAKDAINFNGVFPRTAPYVEECQYPEALDPNVVRGSIVICTFSAGFYNETSTLTAIIDTAITLGFMGFVLVANPSYGDFIAQLIPYTVSGTLIPKVADAKILSEYYEQQTDRDARGFVRQFNARAAIGDGRVASFGSQAPIVSRFSSRGPDFIDINRNPADVLKPDILAPGHEIWAAWSPMSALDPILSGYNFALISGTSMAAPHIGGIAALIKQKYPSWTPSMIASAMSTTATKFDNNGGIIMAEGFDAGSLYPSTYFDIGSGFVSPSHAMDPGLVLSSEFEDYVDFLCSMPNIDRLAIRTATGVWCSQSLGHPANLNIPSVTISALRGSLTVRRSFRNVATRPETYVSLAIPPNGTTVNLHPTWFSISPQGIQDLDIEINVIQSTNEFSFGEIILAGSQNHTVRIPLAIRPVSTV
ncbi:hypothetical protein PTKIN_Ptkin18bG0149200 [Pterospermum kingtungense]